MPATYTPLLRLTKPGLGDTGWGTTANDGITELVDTSVAGTVSVDVTSGNVTLSTANGATDQARHMFIRVFGASVARDVLVPATSKLYFVVNDCTAAVTVKVSGQTGVAIPAGTTAVVRCNGTDVVTSLSYAPALTLGAALAAASGGTGLTSFTANGVVYASSTSALATGSALSFDGTNFGVGGAPNTYSGYTNLTINNAVNGPIFDLNYAGTRQATFLALTNEARIGSIANIPFTFYQNGSEQMRLTSTGLGIGTSSPVQKLHVNGGLTVTSSATLPAALGAMTFSYESAVNRCYMGDGTGYSFAFSKRSASTTTDLMTLDDSGNLGIGTSSPGAKVDAAGNIRVSYSATAANASLVVNNTSSTAASTSQIIATNDASRSLRIQYIASGGAGGAALSGGFTGELAQIFTDNNYPISIGTNSIARLNIDTSGNLGLGVTPSAWWSAMKPLQMSGNGFIGSASNYTYVGANFFYNSSANPVYVASAAASLYEQGAGGHRFFTAPSGTAGNAISFTQAMTLDSSGNLGLGVTPGAWTTYRVMDIGGGQSVISYQDVSTNTVGFAANALWNGSWVYRQSSVGASRYQLANNAHTWFTAPSGTAGNAISFTQAMTLDADGDLGIGTTSPASKLHVKTGTNENLEVRSYSAIMGTGTGIALDSLNDARSSVVDWAVRGTNIALYGSGSTPMTFYTNSTERARITSGGNFVLGSGEGTATPSSFNYFRAPDAAGTNIAGAGLFINAGNGTGTGGSGSIYLQTAKADSSGSSANSMATVLEITPEGNAKFGPVLGQNYVSANGDFRLQNTSYLRIGHGDATNGIVGGYNIYLSSGTPKYENTSGSSPLSGIYYKSDGTLNFYTGPSASGNTNATERAKIPANGGMVVGTAALATTATDGFLYVPTCAGAPTGTPTTQTGTAPIVVDTTNNKLYFYSGGQWRDAGP